MLKGKIAIVSATFGLGNEQVVLKPEEAEGVVVRPPPVKWLNTTQSGRPRKGRISHQNYATEKPFVVNDFVLLRKS